MNGSVSPGFGVAFARTLSGKSAVFPAVQASGYDVEFLIDPKGAPGPAACACEPPADHKPLGVLFGAPTGTAIDEASLASLDAADVRREAESRCIGLRPLFFMIGGGDATEIPQIASKPASSELVVPADASSKRRRLSCCHTSSVLSELLGMLRPGPSSGAGADDADPSGAAAAVVAATETADRLAPCGPMSGAWYLEIDASGPVEAMMASFAGYTWASGSTTTGRDDHERIGRVEKSFAVCLGDGSIEANSAGSPSPARPLSEEKRT